MDKYEMNKYEIDFDGNIQDDYKWSLVEISIINGTKVRLAIGFFLNVADVQNIQNILNENDARKNQDIIAVKTSKIDAVIEHIRTKQENIGFKGIKEICDMIEDLKKGG